MAWVFLSPAYLIKLSSYRICALLVIGGAYCGWCGGGMLSKEAAVLASLPNSWLRGAHRFVWQALRGAQWGNGFGCCRQARLTATCLSRNAGFGDHCPGRQLDHHD